MFSIQSVATQPVASPLPIEIVELPEIVRLLDSGSVVVACGGYRTDTLGEDMELVVRIRRYMADQDKPYRVEYIPDPLCWTEVPSTIKTLARQRSRWKDFTG